MSSVFALSMHATYGCRDRGACCTAGWPIPIEHAELDAAARQAEAGRLRSPSGVETLFLHPPGAPAESPALVASTALGCVFYRDHGAGRCEIHRMMGHAALPLACRQFPRISLHDPRGTSITLSHYCPTAADLLDDESVIAIVEGAPSFAAGAEYTGLDARAALPPLLRPDMLMDWEAWWQWERSSIALVDAAHSAAVAIARLRRAVEHARTWTPAHGSLSQRIAESFERAAEADVVGKATDNDLIGHVVESAPSDVRVLAPRDPRETGTASAQPTSADVHRRFLAAHVFANWTAHLGRGLRTWLASIEAADALVRRGLMVGEADLWLRHLADPRELATRLARAEGGLSHKS
jgi:Fe-S-cluster containining protein